MLTAAQESHLGEYMYQIGNGPARGCWQMEPDTELDIWNNYVAFRPELIEMLSGYTTKSGNDLRDNIAYQIVMARLHYKRVPEPIPSSVEGMAEYWKRYYNTYAGKGTAKEAVENYTRLCL